MTSQKFQSGWRPTLWGDGVNSCLVLGDRIMDLYLQKTGTKPNPEDHTKPAFVGSTSKIGGGGHNVVSNLVDFGMKCYHELPHVSTKYRILDEQGRLLLRFDDDNVVGGRIWANLLRQWLLADGNHCPTLVIADYAKGTVTPELIEMLAGLPVGTFTGVFIDTKRSPQEFVALSEAFGNSCTFLPNRQEYDSYSQLYSNLPSVVRTESEDGVSYVNYGETVLHVPATNNNVVSVCGAGDTVTAAVAASRANGLSWEQSLNVAMRAAGYVVGKPMTSSVPNGHLLIDYYRKINDRS